MLPSSNIQNSSKSISLFNQEINNKEAEISISSSRVNPTPFSGMKRKIYEVSNSQSNQPSKKLQSIEDQSQTVEQQKNKTQSPDLTKQILGDSVRPKSDPNSQSLSYIIQTNCQNRMQSTITFVNEKHEVTWINETKYNGTFDNEKNPHGKGIIEYPSGQTYEGSFIKGKIQGRGKMTWPNGTIYEGEFVESKMHGKGKMTLKDKTIYQGNFANDKLEGKGKLETPDGKIYRGNFLNNKLHGQGKIIQPNGKDKYKYEGECENGQPHGKGEMNWSNGEKTYKGNFSNGQPHGKGEMTWRDRITYKGTFINGMLQGQGEMHVRWGLSYIGEFSLNQFHGKGVLKYDGYTYDGTFFNNALHGKCIVIEPDGKRKERQYFNGRLLLELSN